MKYLFYILGCIFLYAGCEEISDPALKSGNPEIKVDFVPDKTKKEVDTLLTVSNAKIKSYKDTIKNGGDSIYFTDLITQENTVNKSLLDLSTLLKSGRVKLDSVYVIGGLKLEKYQDTTNSVFSLPLNIKSDTTTYVFKYLNLSDTLTFDYKLRSVTGFDKIAIVAYDIQVVNSTFDKITRHYCLSDSCTNGKILYKVYF